MINHLVFSEGDTTADTGTWISFSIPAQRLCCAAVCSFKLAVPGVVGWCCVMLLGGTVIAVTAYCFASAVLDRRCCIVDYRLSIAVLRTKIVVVWCAIRAPPNEWCCHQPKAKPNRNEYVISVYKTSVNDRRRPRDSRIR